MVTNLVCKVRGHAFGPWQYVSNGANCCKQRTCERCGTVESNELAHSWSDWAYAGPAGDEQKRTCGACGRVETRTGACVPGGWRPVEGAVCREEQACARCGRVLSTRDAHAWGVAEYVADGRCDTQRTCARCGVQESPKVEHQWGEWLWVQCTPVRACVRCRTVQNGEAQHSFRLVSTDGRYFNPNIGTERWEHYTHYENYRCERCAATTTRERSHSWVVVAGSEVRKSDGTVVGRRIRCKQCDAEDWEDEIFGKR